LRAETEQYQQRLAQIQQQFQPQQAPDPTTWEGQEYIRQQQFAQLKQELLQAQRQDLQGMIVMAAEQGFANTHQGVDMGSLKSFMRANGIQDGYYEQGLKLMNLNQVPAQPVPQYQFAQQPFVQQPPVVQPIQQPANNIGAIRNGVGAQPQTVQVSLVAAMEAYAKDPNIEKTWSPEFKNAFWQHVNHQPVQ